jgi:Ca2+-binding RTX toxin-like protein
MAQPSNQEQLLLEYINHTRLNPFGEAARYISSYAASPTSPDADIQSALTFFKVSGPALQAALAALTPVQPLAWSSALHDAATGHSNQMIASDQQSHQVPGEPDIGQRVTNAGYTGWTNIAENVYAFSNSMLHAHGGFMVDWGNGPNGMQDPAGHRNSIMNAAYREVGLSAVDEANPATRVGPIVVTQNFGNRAMAPQVFLLGVSYQDTDGNAFYTPGEGRNAMGINASGTNGLTTASGGYTMELTAGAKSITFTGGGLTTPLAVSATLLNGTNVKMDVIDASTIQSTISLSILSGATKLVGLGFNNLNFTGTAGSEQLIGAAGNDVLVALGGADQSQGGSGNDYLYMGEGNDTARGDAGIDVLLLDIGDDYGYGGDGIDYLFGNEGNDTLFGEGDVDVLQGEAGNDIFDGGAGGDYVYGGAGNDFAYGRAGNDIFVMDIGNDTAFGEEGQDYFYMGDGDDSANGGADVDVFLGGAGNDVFDAGSGVDYAWGEAGNDAYVVRAESGVLVVNDFVAGGTDDVLRLSADTGITNVTQALAASTFFEGMNTTILTVDGDTAVWLVGVNSAQLTAADFAFV